MTTDWDAVEALRERILSLQHAGYERTGRLVFSDEIERLQIEENRAARAAELNQARVEEAPLLKDLGAMGVDIPTVWDLYLHPDAYPKVIPVLLQHLSKDYPIGTLQGVGNALCNRAARPWWNDLKNSYLTDGREVVRDRLAVALAQVAVREHYEDLLSLIVNPDLGQSRIFFVRPINKIGNRMSPGRGRAAIEPFANDPDLRNEVTAVMKGQGLAD